MATIIFLLTLIGLQLGCNRLLVYFGAFVGLFVELVKITARFFSEIKED